MFNKKDPIIDSVNQVLDKSSITGKLVQEFNESLGIQDRKALPSELQEEYDAALKELLESVDEQTLDEASTWENWKSGRREKVKEKALLQATKAQTKGMRLGAKGLMNTKGKWDLDDPNIAKAEKLEKVRDHDWDISQHIGRTRRYLTGRKRKFGIFEDSLEEGRIANAWKAGKNAHADNSYLKNIEDEAAKTMNEEDIDALVLELVNEGFNSEEISIILEEVGLADFFQH